MRRWTRWLIVLGAIAGWFLFTPVWETLRAPIAQIAESRNAAISYTSITSGFDIHLQVDKETVFFDV